MTTQREVDEQITTLEHRLVLLEHCLMSEFDLETRNQIEAEIRAVNLALEHFQSTQEMQTDKKSA